MGSTEQKVADSDAHEQLKSLLLGLVAHASTGICSRLFRQLSFQHDYVDENVIVMKETNKKIETDVVCSSRCMSK